MLTACFNFPPPPHQQAPFLPFPFVVSGEASSVISLGEGVVGEGPSGLSGLALGVRRMMRLC
jgi:hypothetical protein